MQLKHETSLSRPWPGTGIWPIVLLPLGHTGTQELLATHAALLEQPIMSLSMIRSAEHLMRKACNKDTHGNNNRPIITGVLRFGLRA